MTRKIQILSILCILLIHPLRAGQMQKDNGYLIYTLGKDTTMIGHYQLNGDDFDMTVLIRSPLEVHKLKGSLFSNGECKYVEGYAYKPAIGKDSLLLQTYKLFTRNDSTFTEQNMGGNLSIFAYSGRGMLHQGIYSYVFFNPLIAQYAPLKTGDSLLSDHLLFGSKDPVIIKRINKNRVTVGGKTMGLFNIYLNQQGKPTYIDAIGSSWNVRGKILPYLNLDSMIHLEAVRAQKFGELPMVNKLESAETTIGSTHIKITYSRPSMRGRIIFGEVVPWNRFWRTGANAATKLTLSGPLYFNNKELPAGEYSIFTMPTKNGWTIMFNKEANIWGTGYNPANDVLSVPMQVEQLKEPVEVMTIEIIPAKGGGVIHVVWEKTKVSVAFTTNSKRHK